MHFKYQDGVKSRVGPLKAILTKNIWMQKRVGGKGKLDDLVDKM